MKKFEFPEINVIAFQAADIIATSDELPFVPYSVITDEFEIMPPK